MAVFPVNPRLGWLMTGSSNNDSNGGSKATRAKSREREERLASELRRNLLKRKEQSRAREAGGPDGDETGR